MGLSPIISIHSKIRNDFEYMKLQVIRYLIILDTCCKVLNFNINECKCNFFLLFSLLMPYYDFIYELVKSHMAGTNF